MKKSIIFILIIFVFSFSVFAEGESGIIKGTTVPGAVVVLGEEEEVVGDNGEFVFEGIEYGEYNLKVIHDDYYEYNDTTSLDKPILDLGEVDLPLSRDIGTDDSGEYYSNFEGSEMVVFSPLVTDVKGKAPIGTIVVLGDREKEVNENGKFIFEDVEYGSYDFLVRFEGQELVKEIEVSGSEDIDLGMLDFDSSDDEDFIDVSENNVSYDLDKDSDEEKIDKERNFDVGEVVVSESVMPSVIDYNCDGGSFKSEYSSAGLYNKLGVSIPFEITFDGFKHKVSFNFDKSNAFAKTAQETVKNDSDIISNIYMLDLSTDGYGFAVKYDYQFDKFGFGFLSLGRDYYKHSLDKSEYSSGDSGYSREFRFGKGWSVGGGFVASLDYFNTYELDYVDFSEMKFGFDFEYVPTLIDVKDTDFFANTMVEGSKVEYDLFLGYENYEIGYRNVSYNSKEYVSGENLWPATTTTYQGPYFDLTFFF